MDSKKICLDDSSYFAPSIELYEALGKLDLGNGQNLIESLKLVGGVSLWDSLSTYLILYRFPLCYENSPASFRGISRPYLGRLAHLRDEILSMLGRRADVEVNLQCNDNPTILILRFSESFYQGVLHPIHQKLGNLLGPHKIISLTKWKRDCAGNCYNVLDFFTPEMTSKKAIGITAIKKLTKLIVNLADIVGVSKEFSGQLNRSQLRRELLWLCTREFPRLLTVAMSGYAIMETNRPSLILTADDADQKCKLLELIGAEYAVPSLVVQQGITRKDYPDWKYFSGDHVAVMGESSIESICAQGVSLNRLTITGHPGLDQYLNVQISEVADTRRQLNINADEVFILFTSQPFIPNAFKSKLTRDEMIKSAVTAATKFANVKLVVKPHPSDNVSDLKNLCNGFSNVVLVERDWSTPSLIKACDAFVTMFSQTTFEALYAGKPVININYWGSGISADFLSEGATLLVRTHSELTAAYKALSNGDLSYWKKDAVINAAANLLREWAFIPDGRAGDRVVELIQRRYLTLPHHHASELEKSKLNDRQ